MASSRRPRRVWPLVLTYVVALVLIGVLIALTPPPTLLGGIVRSLALLGYLNVFLAIMASIYMRQLVRILGRPFIKVHHALSVAGLVLLTLHPLGAAWLYGDLRVLIPRTESLRLFLQWGGPPALYLIGLASLAGLWRTKFRNQWRAVHMLTYLAFILATLHGRLLGTDFQHLAVTVVSLILLLVVVAAFIQKRLQRRRLLGGRR